MLYFGIAGLYDRSETAVFTQQAMAAAAGIFLLAGLWTPVMATLVAFHELWMAFSAHSPLAEHTWIHIFMAVQSLSVTMLGPGAWSMDARLFGRKRFDIDRMNRRSL